MNDRHKMTIARGRHPAEVVLKNARVVNVFTLEIERADVAVEDGVILGVGEYSGKEEIDLAGAYLAPGFIDGHVHIESSMVTPAQFSAVILPKGTTTIIADPHEIANVSGADGIRYMLENAKKAPLEVYMMIPSSVPATEFETAGATIGVEDIRTLAKEPGVLGLGEVMNYPGVLEGDDDIHGKIRAMQPAPIDGHAPGVLGNDLNAYVAAGVQTDHECSTVEELLERIKRGMYVHLREGSATRNVRTLLEGFDPQWSDRLLFCTDDKHPEDIRAEGHINYNVNLAIEAGVPPLVAIRMATLNAANAYGLDRHGAIAPGRKADFIVFDSLERIEPRLVYKEGRRVAQDGEPLFKAPREVGEAVRDTVHVDPAAIDFTLRLQQERVKVIGLIEKNITTRCLIETVNVEEGTYVHDPSQDRLKLAVIERHHGTNNYGLGLVRGFGFQGGAIAMTIAHDSHNLVVVGDDDASMRAAMEKIVEIQGGIVLAKEGVVDDYLRLDVAGIMSTKPSKVVAQTLERMKGKVRGMGLSKTIDDPFISLAFLSLPVIPDLKLTDNGLFDVRTFSNVAIEAEAGGD